MRAAIRGDFERLEERRGEQVLLRPREQAEDEAIRRLEGPESPQEVAGDETPEPSPKRSWIDRLLGL